MREISTISIIDDSFQTWLLVTNELANSLSTEIVTANGTLGVTGNTSFNRHAHLYGRFSANTIAATGELRGGNNTVAGVLTVVSNTYFSNLTGVAIINNTIEANNASVPLVVTSNTDGTRWAIKLVANTIGFFSDNSNTSVLNSNTFSYNSRTYRQKIIFDQGGDVTLNSANLQGKMYVQNNYTFDISVNTDIGSVTGSNVIIYTFPKTSYSSGKLQVQIKKSGNVEFSELLFAHDSANVWMSSYGNILAPNTASSLATFDAGINGSNVEIYAIQSNANSAVTVVAHLIK